jgi:hypothetical protein
MRPIIQGIVVICRDGLDHVPLSNSIPDSELRPFATLLFNRIKADDSEAALRKTVADFQIKLGLSVKGATHESGQCGAIRGRAGKFPDGRLL